MDVLPIISGISAAVFFGISDYLVTMPSRKLGQYRSVAYSMLFSALTILPVVLIMGIAKGITPFDFAMGMAASICLFIGILLADTAFRYGNLSITAPIVNAYPGVIVLGAVFLLGDKLLPVELLGICMVIAGIVLVSMKFSALGKRKGLFAAGIGAAILSSFFLGVVGIFSGVYTALIGFALFSFMQRSTSSVLGFVSVKAAGQEFWPRKDIRGMLPQLAGAGFADGIGVLSVLYAIFVNSANLPIVGTLGGFAGGISVIAALVMLKEKPERNQWLGIILAVLGAVLLSYFS